MEKGDGVRVDVSHTDGVTLVVLAGEVDLAAEAALNRVFEEVDAGRRIVVDCSGVLFMDSTGLRLLLHHFTRARAAGGNLRVRNPSEQVVQLLRISGVDERGDA